ncbi:uncharacterized protein EDB91DRAFT_1238142 [Suillus paluster]|uniref:uncharacterized protein n=1 Tax=Suillus paluster TaxID=48578 RepID=UPI001B874DBE|nr:uncharacterized protein EDB91DRAFT_1238142 [Suillus paluster]KAG1735898.1 hypothetical protein EDB91DRAFT_1238142 [Suillus paluster]
MPRHLSFTKANRCAAAKRKKVNIYTSQLSSASSSIHETYTFISQKQGFSAHGSHVTAKTSASSVQLIEAMDSSLMTDSHTNHDFSDFTGADIETECLETEDNRKCKHTAGDHPLLSWKAERDTFLLEFLQHNGQGDYMDLCVCGNCGFGHPEFRCMGCFSRELFCSLCIVALHTRNPLHQIQKWTGSSFVSLSLKQLGLRVQLGHLIGEDCLLPRQAFNDDFTIIHTNGIHKVGLDYCGCDTAQTHTTQLLPTFRILEQYHLLSFESKACGYGFYHAIARLTDNTGLHPYKDQYEAFLWMVREWRHFKMLKRSWEGECAVVCPACPQPGKNLPDDWQEAPDDKRWLYALFVTIDANFRLKRRAISKDGIDPGLSRGWAYFVEETAYKSHMQHTCSSHNAVNMADTEGCVNVLNVSYNIACQWHKNLWQCMSTMLAHLQLDHTSKLVRLFVPKFHLPAHILKCQSAFSFNFSKNVGWWSNINPVASSTKEMGPGSRRDTLDDHFGDWNWKKSVGLGATLLCKMNEANEEHQAHASTFEELNEALAPETTAGWRACVEHWEENPNNASVPNPFEMKVSTITQAAVQLKLVELESRQLREGNDISLHPDILPSVFIATGIDLESEQQKTVLVRQQNALQRKVDAWKQVQLLYTPTAQLLASQIESIGIPDNPLAEDIKLLLPSLLTADSISCSPHLHTIEWELQIAQAGDALDEIRQSLRLRNYLYTFKQSWIRGQSVNTWAQNALGRVEARATASAEKYCAAHAALSSLAPVLNKVGWNLKFCSLNNRDNVCGMMVPRKGESEGRRQLSWIWLVEGVGDDEDEVVQDCLRVEWCKARTRMMHWKEEIELLEEEMHRILQFIQWHALWWDNVAHLHALVGAEKEGVVAYATRQAHLHRDLSAKFETSWA